MFFLFKDLFFSFSLRKDCFTKCVAIMAVIKTFAAVDVYVQLFSFMAILWSVLHVVDPGTISVTPEIALEGGRTLSDGLL